MVYEIQEESSFPTNSRLLSAPRRPLSRQSINTRRSSASLRSPTLSQSEMGEDNAGTRFSLAHELAVALMPEPTAGSKLLSEEFGIEYTVEDDLDCQTQLESGSPLTSDHRDTEPLAGNSSDSTSPNDISGPPTEPEILLHQVKNTSISSVPQSPTKHFSNSVPPRQDALELLAHDLKSTDNFLSRLRTLDIDGGSSGSQSPALERLATDVIRRINETVRDREGQVRELLGYEREFRRIAGELGGNDVLSHLDELEHVDDLSDGANTPTTRLEMQHALETVLEEPSLSLQNTSTSQDWECDPDGLHEDDNEDHESVSSPVKESFPPPPLIAGHTTPAKTIPQLTHLRSFTTSLIASLTTLSEHAQVNGATTTEAGRKIRALKNKLGGWRTDWDSAERSRLKIDRWEAGILDKGDGGIDITLAKSHSTFGRRMDGRLVVQEHLRAFEVALADAAKKTQAIMAS